MLRHKINIDSSRSHPFRRIAATRDTILFLPLMTNLLKYQLFLLDVIVEY